MCADGRASGLVRNVGDREGRRGVERVGESPGEREKQIPARLLLRK